MTMIVRTNLLVNAASGFEDVRARVFIKALIEYMTSNERESCYEASDSCLIVLTTNSGSVMAYWCGIWNDLGARLD